MAAVNFNRLGNELTSSFIGEPYQKLEQREAFVRRLRVGQRLHRHVALVFGEYVLRANPETTEQPS